ncbi:MAG TPA: isoprenylcysteine carboxylmethyltransferase family protein [Chitinophagaceae bacterium]|nr:isoprenylcysteine carboxylmethyltransferase family protein [Chitinophagaceae bacterium]
MEKKKDSPGVYFPPPLIYVLIFIAGAFIQKKVPLDNTIFQSRTVKIIGIIFLCFALFFSVRSLRQFFKSKNTLIPFKPASSLQTGGIYSISRNPMYVALAIVYLGIACLVGNWWNIILFPILILVVQEYIIKSEERYLQREFQQQFKDYRKKVRRWL